MENTAPGPKLSAFPIKIKVGDTAEEVHLLLNADSELVAVSNPALLNAWLNARPTPAPAKQDVSATMSRDIHFFGAKPCWFEGCAEMREEYAADLKELQEKEGCRDCEKGALLRKYLQRVAAAQAQ